MHGGQARIKAQRGALPSLGGLDKQLGLARRGRADGARNLPAADAAEWSEAERALADALEGERARIAEARAAARADAERRLRALAPSPQDFQAPAREAKLALRQVEGRVAHDWGEAAREARAARAELAAFKDANALRRPALYPDSTLLQAGLLMCAAVFEALFSATLFAETDARGLLGGAITAVGLSGANVTLGFLSGYIGLRYLQHARWPLKTAGAFGFAAFALLALMLNLFAADWRDAIAAQSEHVLDAGSDVSFHLWSLLQLDSPQAIILLMLGAGVWVFAALKGYSGFDDPYPDYGKLDRAARAAADDLADARAEARETLEQPIDAARAAVSAQLSKSRAEFEAMTKAFDAAALRMQGLDAEAAALDELYAAAVRLYRAENAAARTVNAPAYFAETPRLSPRPEDALAGAAALIDGARADLAAAQTQAGAALEALGAELEAATRRLDAAEP